MAIRRGTSGSRALAIAWTLLLVAILWAPAPEQRRLEWEWLDETVHVLLFFGFAAAWRRTGAGVGAIVWGAVVLAGVTEVGQGFLPWPRSPDAIDVLCDVGGALLGAVVAGLASRRAVRPRPSEPPGAAMPLQSVESSAEIRQRNGRDSNPR